MGDLREIVACDGIAEEQDVRKLRVSMLGPNFHVHSISSGIEAGFWARTEEDSIRKPRERTTSARITTRPRGGFVCAASNALSRPKVIAIPRGCKAYQEPAYRLPTVNRTIATVRLAMSELSSSLAGCEERCMV